MRIAIFDYKVIPTNPSGGCHRRVLEALCLDHDFTIFAVEFDNPCPHRVTWVRIPVPTRPLVLLFLSYHVVAPMAYLAHRLRHRVRYDLVQRVENNLSFGHVSYVHFCHRFFLSRIWPTMGTRGLRARVRWLDHLFHALLEPVIYKRTLHFVVPSIGLEREFANEYEFAIPRIVRIPNPIDVDRYMTPKNFDRERIRQRHNLAPQDVVLVFTALGQFERKGLPLVLEALPDLPEHVKLMVVGGSPDLVRTYERRAAKMGLKNRTVFVGMTKDLRQYLWSADVFIFPSFYEVFSLSAHEAAAAGLPIIATPVHGLTESFRDQENAFLIESTVDGVRAGIERFISLSETERAEMGVRGRETVQQYHPSRFGDRWKNFYEAFADSLPR